MYSSLLASYGKTLEDISKDNSENAVTTITDKAVDFDNYIDTLYPNSSEKHSKPSSCDALYYSSNGNYFFIEFKNGDINYVNSKEDNIRKKISESLLFLTEISSSTIVNFKQNLTFILVYNSRNSKSMISSHITAKATINIDRYKYWLKAFIIQDAVDFDKDFVSKYR